MKNIKKIYLKIFIFWVVKLSIYLNKRVFVMKNSDIFHISAQNSIIILILLEMLKCPIKHRLEFDAFFFFFFFFFFFANVCFECLVQSKCEPEKPMQSNLHQVLNGKVRQLQLSHLKK